MGDLYRIIFFVGYHKVSIITITTNINPAATVIVAEGTETQDQEKQSFMRQQEVNSTHVPIITPSSSQSPRRRGSGNNNSNYSGNGSSSANSSFAVKSGKASRTSLRSCSEPYPTGAVIPRKFLCFLLQLSSQ